MRLPKPRKKKRLPSLNVERLTQFNAQVQELAIPHAAQNAIMQSMIAAANMHAETPQAVIASLDAADRDAVQTAMRWYAPTLARMNQRGKQGLMSMSDAEWSERAEVNS